MPSKIELRLGANTSELKRSVLDVSKVIHQNMGKSKISLISEDTKNLLKSEMKAQIEELGKQTELLSKKADFYAQKLKAGVSNAKQELTYRKRLLEITKQLGVAESNRSQLSGKGSGAVKGGGIGGGGMLGGLGRFLANPVTAILAMGAGAGLYGLSKARQGFGQYEAGIPDRVALMARGERDLTVRDMRFGALGMNAEDVLRSRRGAMDVFGREGATEESVRRRALFERGMGVESGTLTQMGGGLRAGMGTAEAGKAMIKIQAAALASGIEDAIGPYLETAANMLTELNRDGFAMDTQTLTALNSFVKLAGDDQTERMGRVLMGLDAAIKGSTGEANAFLQMAASEAGLGGGTIGGLQDVLKAGGLFGQDLNKVKGLGKFELEALQQIGLDDPEYFKNLAGGISKALDRQYGTDEELSEMSKEKRGFNVRQRARFLGRMGFGKNVTESSEVSRLLKEMETAVPERQAEIKDRIKQLKGDKPEDAYKNWEAIKNSNVNQLTELKVQTQILLSIAGEKVGDLVAIKRRAEKGLIGAGLGNLITRKKALKIQGEEDMINFGKTMSFAESEKFKQRKKEEYGRTQMTPLETPQERDFKLFLDKFAEENKKGLKEVFEVPLKNIEKNTKNNSKTTR